MTTIQWTEIPPEVRRLIRQDFLLIVIRSGAVKRPVLSKAELDADAKTAADRIEQGGKTSSSTNNGGRSGPTSTG